jgi:hypothetical protein
MIALLHHLTHYFNTTKDNGGQFSDGDCYLVSLLKGETHSRISLAGEGAGKTAVGLGTVLDKSLVLALDRG